MPAKTLESLLKRSGKGTDGRLKKLYKRAVIFIFLQRAMKQIWMHHFTGGSEAVFDENTKDAGNHVIQ